MAVSIRKGGDIRENLEAIFSELTFVPGKRVYVKPNLCGRLPILPGENTSIKVMDALIEALRARGCEVIIGHGALLGTRERHTPFVQTLRESGFAKYLTMPGVAVVDLDELERREVTVDGTTFHLPIAFLWDEVDTYINLAKIKTHMETGVSLSLKNQMGLPTPADRKMMHRTDLEQGIARLGRALAPDLNILEGYPAMEGNGPHHGSAKNLRLLAAGTDMVELDSLMAILLGYTPAEITHIMAAAQMGVGNPASPELARLNRKYYIPGFRKAETVFRFGRKFNAYPTYSCSLCISAMNEAGREFKRHPLRYWRVLVRAFFSRTAYSIVFGRADKLSVQDGSRILCIGSCAKTFAQRHGVECLDSCPPGIDETRRFIMQ